MTKKMLNYKTNQYFDNLPYHNVIKYDMGSEQEVKQAYKDGYHECEKTLIEATEIIKELIYADGRFADSYPQLINKAEQFLKENAELKNKLTEKVTLESLDVVSARMDDLEKEAKQSYLDNTDHMQWDVEGEFDYTRGYLNGAEPREKRIEELEMTVGTLRTFNNEQAICIERLEKENAGLRARINSINSLTPELEKRSKLKNQQLTEAIELLKWALHSDPEHDNLDDFDTKWKEAEQFIKEIEK